MARPEDRKIVAAMKKAKTAREMVMSWATQAPGRNMEPTLKNALLFVEKKPEMIEVFAQNPLMRAIDHEILDGKTRELVLLGIVLGMKADMAVSSRVANAKGAGCTEEEMMEVAYLACYQAGKEVMQMSAKALYDAFQRTANVTSREEVNNGKKRK
jgi:alkylhydroperoxidase/carboxymuconolactone decarboxylase family protein YurZ